MYGIWTISDDPVRDAAAYDAACEPNPANYPECDHCGEPIVAGDEFIVDGGAYYHYECAQNMLIKMCKVMEERNEPW